jgi:hypothetical protein
MIAKKEDVAVGKVFINHDEAYEIISEHDEYVKALDRAFKVFTAKNVETGKESDHTADHFETPSNTTPKWQIFDLDLYSKFEERIKKDGWYIEEGGLQKENYKAKKHNDDWYPHYGTVAYHVFRTWYEQIGEELGIDDPITYGGYWLKLNNYNWD